MSPVPIFGVVFAACCTWLTLRIIDRRERWAINLALLAGVAVLWFFLVISAWNHSNP
jgi:hypothetical protein